MRVAIILLIIVSSCLFQQRRWQRAHKLKSVGPQAINYWLSTDPNHFCADLNFDDNINFFDYAVYLKHFVGD